MRAARRRILAFAAAGIAAGTLAGAGAAHGMGVNLTLAITAGPTQATIGTPTSYSFTVTNFGDTTAQRPHLSFRLGDKEKIAKITAATTDLGTCTVTSSTNVAECVAPSLDTQKSFHVQVTVAPSAKGNLTVHVDLVTPKTTDVNPADNSAVIETAIAPPDTGPPSGLHVTAGPSDATAKSFDVAWHPTSKSPGSTYTVRYRAASWKTGFGSYIIWRHADSPGRATFHGKPGWTYCFSAQGADRLGAESAWSAERCISVPIAARSMRQTGHWKLGQAAHSYLGLYRHTTAKGSALWLLGAEANRIDLRVARCKKCGKIAVFFGGKLLKEVALDRGKRGHGIVIRVFDGSTVRKGNLAIEVVSSGKPVEVEGVVAARA
jgi:Domain of unknown function DUF11